MLRDVMLHDSIVSMSVNPNVWIMGETVVHDATEYSMSIGIAGNPMDNMIRTFIIKPLTFIKLGVCWFWG